MNEFIFYRRKLVDNKYKKIYKKGKSKKEYVKSQGKYVLLTVYKKNLKKKNIKKGGDFDKNLKDLKLQLRKKLLTGGTDSITTSDIKFDANNNYIQSPECKMIYDNPEQYGLTRAELNDTSDSKAITILESRFPNLSSSGGGKKNSKRSSKQGRKKYKKGGGTYISEYLTKIN